MFENYSDVQRKAGLVIAGTYFETMQSVDELKKTIKKDNVVKVLMQNSNRTGHRDLLAVPVYLGDTAIFDMENAEVLVDGEEFDRRQAEAYEKQRAEAEAKAKAESTEETEETEEPVSVEDAEQYITEELERATKVIAKQKEESEPDSEEWRVVQEPVKDEE